MNILADMMTGAAMTSTRVIDNLRRVEIFAGLIDEDLLKVADLCKAVRVPADRAIFNEELRQRVKTREHSAAS